MKKLLKIIIEHIEFYSQMKAAMTLTIWGRNEESLNLVNNITKKV